MSTINKIKEKFKEFKPTSWSITNKTSIYLLMLFISLGGIYQFLTLPKEQFPEIVIPTMYVQTVYVGNSPKDIENLVTRPIEKQIKAITGVKINKFTSVSQQDFSAITVEFNTSVKPDIALQKVKDAVDKAKNDLPNDLTQEPRVIEVNFSEQPIMYVNISGNYSSVQLKKYADDLKDKLENITQVNRVDLVGAPEREFQINVDNFRMQSSGITFDDITYAIQRENLDLSGGLLEVGTMQRNLQLKGQLKNANDIANIIVRNTSGAPIYLRDVAKIVDTVKKNESYARLDGKNVLTLNIIKRSGENLIETSDAVKKIVDEAAKQLFTRKPDYVAPGGNAYGQKQRAQCLRDYSWYLRLVTYGVLSGSTELIQQIGLVGAREMYNSLGVPMPGMVEAMRTMKDAALVLLSTEQAAIAGPYFDYLIQGMQTST